MIYSNNKEVRIIEYKHGLLKYSERIYHSIVIDYVHEDIFNKIGSIHFIYQTQ